MADPRSLWSTFDIWVFLFVCVQNYCSDWLDFVYARRRIRYYPSLSPPHGWSITRSESGLKNLLKDSSPLGDRTNYDIKTTPWRQMRVMVKKCIMRSKVHHRERGFYDCLICRLELNIPGPQQLLGQSCQTACINIEVATRMHSSW